MGLDRDSTHLCVPECADAVDSDCVSAEHSRLMDKSRAIVSSPAYATITTGLAVITGWLGSIYERT